jgi:hypothetical protein
MIAWLMKGKMTAKITIFTKNEDLLILPMAALAQHVIVLGKTGASKSSAMRLLVENLLFVGKLAGAHRRRHRWRDRARAT